MKRTCYLLFFIFIFFSCKEQYNHRGKSPLIQVNDQFLYQEDLESIIPRGMSSEDSLRFSEEYIENWAKDVLLYAKANENIPNTERINALVENYRHSLVMHTYQQQLIKQRLSKELTDDELLKYYQSHQDIFTVDRPILKGLFLKVPLSALKIKNVRKWYKDTTQVAIDKLEKYSFQNALTYKYFYDTWKFETEIKNLFPAELIKKVNFRDKRNIELKDTAFYYFLNIKDYLSSGNIEPFDYAKSKVVEMISNEKEVDFMNEVKKELFKEALDKNKIIYKYKK